MGGKKKKEGICLKESRLKKKLTLEQQREKEMAEMGFESMFSGGFGEQSATDFMGQTSKMLSMEGTQTNGFQSRRKVCFGSNSGYSLKVFDFTRK